MGSRVPGDIVQDKQKQEISLMYTFRRHWEAASGSSANLCQEVGVVVHQCLHDLDVFTGSWVALVPTHPVQRRHHISLGATGDVLTTNAHVHTHTAHHQQRQLRQYSARWSSCCTIVPLLPIHPGATNIHTSRLVHVLDGSAPPRKLTHTPTQALAGNWHSPTVARRAWARG